MNHCLALTEQINDNVTSESQLSLKVIITDMLNILKAPVPAGKKFPFTIPDVDWTIKLLQGKFFLHHLIEEFESLCKTNKVTIMLQELLILLDEASTPDIIQQIKMVRNQFDVFNQLREILSNEELSSNQIKRLISRYVRRLQKQLNNHPYYQIIISRLKKYHDYLYHTYNDSRIPRTNLEIERLFNRRKRDFRKRTGIKTRKSFIYLEGELYFLLDHYKAPVLDNTSGSEFIKKIKKKRQLLTSKEFKELLLLNKRRKQRNRVVIGKKYSSRQANVEFLRLKKQLKEISLKTN